MIESKPLVSIIVNCYNGEKFLEECLSSIKNQTYKNWELIFWDNQSSDNSSKIFKKFKDRRFKYFLSKKKTVLYEARNLAIKKAQGEFLAFLDVDDFWDHKKLSLQIPKFKKKKTGLVYSNFYKYYNNDKKVIAFKNKLPSGKVTSAIIKNYQIGLVTVVIRKSFLDKTKLFDFKYDLLSDYAFILNFSLKYKFIGVNKPLASYRIHVDQLSKKKMVLQAKQFCQWVDKKNIKKKFKNYDLTTLKKRYDYYSLIKELDNSKIKLFLKLFKKFSFVLFIKISAFIFLPRKLVFKFMDNV
tara:strand:+ start:637 stop:1530 length:894 start_codon:yes stop_codon:yes gene_type:complete